MRILGLDIGKKKIGIALSDALGITAQGLKTLIRSDKKRDFEDLAKIITEREVSRVIVGLPLNMNGTKGPKGFEAEEFANDLKREINRPVDLWDERLTTMEATRLLLTADISRKKRRFLDDKIAAQLILQSYLDSLEKKL